MATALAAGAGVLVLLAPSAALAAAAPSSIDLSRPVDAFKGGAHLYLYPGGDALVDAATQARINTALSNSKVWLTVLPSPSLGPVDSHTVAQSISDSTGKRGSYVLLGSAGGTSHFLQTVSPVSTTLYASQTKAAITAHRGQPGAEALAYVTELATDPVPAKPFPTGTVVGLVAAVLVLAALFLIVGFRQRQRRRSRDNAVADVRVELDSLTDDLLSADPAGRVALRDVSPDDAEQRALRVAWSRQQAAEAMLGRGADAATARRAQLLVRQGRAALEQAMRLREGLPAESEVLAKAAVGPGPDPAQRRDQAGAAAPGQQRMLPQWTAASYPGYGYGWYPGYGYGFFNYGGSFVTGLLAGELLADAFNPWGGYGGFGGWSGYGSGYDQGYDSGYDQGYGSGYDQGNDSGDGSSSGDFVSGDPGYATDSSFDASQDPYAGDTVSGDPGYGSDAGWDSGSYDSGMDSGGFDSGGFDSGGFDGGFDGGGGSDT